MKVQTMDWVVAGGFFLVLAAVVAIATPGSEPTEAEGSSAALREVAASLDPDMAASLQVSSDDLRSAPNPLGGGTVVYLSYAPGGSFPRKPVWLRWQDTVYAVNGPAKELTPPLSWVWPRPEAGPRERWLGSGMVGRSTAELVRQLYGP